VRLRPIRIVTKAGYSAVGLGEPLPNQLLNKCLDMILRFIGHVLSIEADLLKEGIYGVFPVEKLPYEDACRTQAKAVAGIRVEEDGPVVKLLPEYYVRVGYEFFIVFHGRTFSLTPTVSPGRATLAESTQR
jgi:hypothetical protein